MPDFSYRGFDKTGSEETGSVEASGEKLAYDILQSRGLTVYELTYGSKSPRASLPWYRRDIQLGNGQLSFSEQATIADLLAALFQSGLPVTEVLRVAALSVDSKPVKRQFERVEQRIEDGQTIANAFEAENKLLSPMFISFLKVSDAANELPELLRALARFFRGQYAIRQKLISALIYPAILIHAAIALLLVVVLYLAPNLSPIFTSVGKEPPGTITVLMQMNVALREYGAWIGIGSICVFIAMAALVQIPTVRVRLRQLRYHLPLIGNLLQLSELSQLAQAAKLLLASGQSLPQALRGAGGMGRAGSKLASQFDEAALTIEAGGTAFSVFDENSILPAIFKELFRIGETTNTLPSTLRALSTALSEDVDRQSQRLLGLLTPLLTLLLGLGIGFLIYTLMGAILEVNELAF